MIVFFKLYCLELNMITILLKCLWEQSEPHICADCLKLSQAGYDVSVGKSFRDVYLNWGPVSGRTTEGQSHESCSRLYSIILTISFRYLSRWKMNHHFTLSFSLEKVLLNCLGIYYPPCGVVPQFLPQQIIPTAWLRHHHAVHLQYFWWKTVPFFFSGHETRRSGPKIKLAREFSFYWSDHLYSKFLK